MAVDVRFKGWVTAAVVVPLGVLLLAGNALLWHHLSRERNRVMTDIESRVREQMNSALSAEANRMRTLAALPLIEHLLEAVERRRSTESESQRREKNREIQEVWTSLERGDIRVRNALDNQAGEMLREMARMDPRLESLFLTDSAGGLLAASEKTDRYIFPDRDWWVAARAQQPPSVVSDGLIAPGILGLSLAVHGPAGIGFAGVLRERLNLAEIQPLPDGVEVPDGISVALVGGEGLPLVGDAEVVGAAVDALFPDEDENGDGLARDGWRQGFHYRLQPLGSSIEWIQAVDLLTVRPRGAVDMAVAGPVALSTLLSLAVFGGFLYFLRHRARQALSGPLEEMINAGDWALEHAGAQVAQFDQQDVGGILHISRRHHADRKRIAEALDGWLVSYQSQIEDMASARTREVKRDLELARDFQMAYLDRPYPKIPAFHVEGHQRLNFTHRYQPALALGGDFFDILTLGQDCAGVFVADVMGHGTRSALITAILRTLLGDLAPQGRNARHLMTEINKQFSWLIRSVPNPLFASAFYFVADVTSRMATFSAAGHPAPFHLRRSVGRVSRLQVPTPRSAALGLLPNEVYTGGHCRLISGDVFIFFTDGVYEAPDSNGEEFGLGRMEQVIRRLLYKDIEAITDGIMEELEAFTGREPVADDICLVVLEVTTEADKTHAGSTQVRAASAGGRAKSSAQEG